MRNITLQNHKVSTLVRIFHKLTTQIRFWVLVIVAVAVLVTMLFLAVGNGQTQDTIKVNLNEKSGIAPIQQISGDAHSQPSDNSLRVAIAGVLSPSKTLQYYQELLAYMEQELDRNVTLILKPTYAEINDLVKGQRADIAFVCSLAYVKGKDDFDMELLVVPQMYGTNVYYSYLIVPEGSSASSLEDLRGASFAFTDPMSNSGRLVPTYQLFLLGETPFSFFSKYIFTYSHDHSILAVADKLVNGAAVDSLVYEQLLASDPELGLKAKIIARWGPFGIPPVVISPTLDSQLKQQLRAFFLALHKSDQGTKILNNLAIDKFEVANDDIYDTIREMKAKLGL